MALQQISQDESQGLQDLENENRQLRLQLKSYQDGINRALEVCRELARGNLEPRILRIHEEGPLGEVLHAINALLDLTDAFAREAGGTLKASSEGRFYRKVLPHGLLGTFRSAALRINDATEVMSSQAKAIEDARNARLKMADDFELAIKSVVDCLAAASTQLQATAGSLEESASRTNDRSIAAVQASEATSASMMTVASATEEISVTAQEIDRQVQETLKVTDQATRASNQTGKLIEELRLSSDRISSVVRLISEVADQSRLLGLNATLEAARVGAMGRGFAVVATEVKQLATQTAGATRDIGEQVHAIQQATRSVVMAMSEIDSTIQHLQDVSGAVAAAVGEQKSATSEISRGVQVAANGSKNVSDEMERVSQDVKETSFAAEQMRAASQELSRLIESLRCDVDRFIWEIRHEPGRTPHPS